MSEWRETEFGKIPKDWKYIKASEFCTKVTDGTHDSPKRQVEGKPLITSKHIKGREIDFDNAYLISLKDFKKINERSHVNQWDVIISMIGEYCGFTYIERNIHIDYAVKNVGLFKVGAKIKALWLHYFLNSPTGKYILDFNKGGSSQPYISLGALRELPILLPPLPEQRAIASVLSSLDDKIDLLHRQNRTIEALAETLFRKMFIEDAPQPSPRPSPKGRGSEGADESWEEGRIPDEFDFTMGLSPPGESYNEIGQGIPMYQGNADFEFRFPKKRVYTNDPRRFAEKFDTLISVRAPVGAQNMADEKCCIGRGVAAFRYKKNENYYTYTYFKLRSLMDEIKQYNFTGTVFGSINKGGFENFEIIIPPIDLVEQFQEICKPVDNKIITNAMQIKILEKLRDSFLPKLMSGEVRVEI